MNFVLSIVPRERGEEMLELCQKRSFPLTLSMLGRGTATSEILDLLGLTASEKTVLFTFADDMDTRRLIRDARLELYIDIPGNGMLAAIPVKSVGGARTMAFLDDKNTARTDGPKESYPYELVVVILNEGYTDLVMDAARAAGASGGTVLHAKGTGAAHAEKFFGVSLADEKEILLILSRAVDKADIMRAILQDAGPDSEAGSIVFSLPVDRIAGLHLGRKRNEKDGDDSLVDELDD